MDVYVNVNITQAKLARRSERRLKDKAPLSGRLSQDKRRTAN